MSQSVKKALFKFLSCGEWSKASLRVCYPQFLKLTSHFCLLVLVAFSPIFFSKADDFIFKSSSFSYASEKDFWENYSQDRRFSIMWSTKSGGQSYADITDEAYLFDVRANVKVKYRLLDRLSFNGKMNLLFRTGNAQVRFGEFLPTGVNLGYGHFDFDVLGNDTINLKLGALNQAHTMPFTALGQRAFPGVAEEFNVNFNDEVQLKTSFQQLIPTSYTYNTDLIEKESLPNLLTANSSLCYSSTLEVCGAIGYFNYSTLPGKVADQSRFTGNTIRGTGNPSEFVFDFQGWLAELNTKYNLSYNSALGFSIQMLENTSAPQSYNQLQTLMLYGSYRFNKDLGLSLIVGDYFIESDAVPSFYTPTGFGNTNRKGQFIEVAFEWVPQKVRISGRYTKADVINADDLGRQYDADFIFINLETSYDTFF